MSELNFEQQKEIENLIYSNKMKCCEYIRATESCKHEWEKERMRIKNAEIRKNIERKNRR